MILRPHRSTLFPYTTLFRSTRASRVTTFGRISHSCGGSRRWPREENARRHSSRLRGCLRAPTWCRSEEHTSELQSRFDLVCRLLLEKKKNLLDKNIFQNYLN